jgi:nicotinate-nucleotide pyrophosphorylase (carboxylating)
MRKVLKSVVAKALREDIGRGDITTRAMIPPRRLATGTIFTREPAVVCGIEVARAAFTLLDPSVRVQALVRDGRRVRAGAALLRIRGRARTILTGERVALNFLQRLCGIATLTAEFVRRVRGTRAKILDTRKTTPGLRELEKYAVRCGGGTNHRRGLDDAGLIKDNHLALGGDLASAVRRLKSMRVRVEVEAQSLKQVREQLQLPIDVIMLDNFPLTEMRRAVRLIRRARPDMKIEASGGVTLQTVREIARTGVDRISVGALTHSVRSLDISMDIA